MHAYRMVWTSVGSVRVLANAGLADSVKKGLGDLTPGEYKKYFEARLQGRKLRKSGSGYITLCVFHDDHNPSLSISFERGVFNCHSCQVKGGVLEFEMQFSKCDKQTATQRIAEITGNAQLFIGEGPEAVYPYTDIFGKLLFQVVRYPGKRFTQRRPDKDKVGWVYKTEDIAMVPYNLPLVTTRRFIFICEGEKDCNNLQEALEKYPDMAVTTSPRGAGKWQDKFSVYLADKKVIILPDNDEPGRKHAEAVARSVSRYTETVKIVNLPNLPEKGDVSDFLKISTVEEIFNAAQGVRGWKEVAKEGGFNLIGTISEFEKSATDTIDWLVEGLIQRGANGLFIARPKSGKSFCILDLAVAIASGQRWLDFYIPKRARVTLVSREDYFGLTQARERKIRKQRQLMTGELEDWLYINAKGMHPKFTLDNEEKVEALISDLKKSRTEFLILDVMRVLHSFDENDNNEMQKVIDTLNRIQEQCGCSICLIHHDNKREDASLTERARGASAIAGYAEFIFGIRVVDEEEHVREFNCELKAAMAPDKFHFKILDTADDGITLDRVTWTPKNKRAKGKADATSFSGNYENDRD